MLCWKTCRPICSGHDIKNKTCFQYPFHICIEKNSSLCIPEWITKQTCYTHPTLVEATSCRVTTLAYHPQQSMLKSKEYKNATINRHWKFLLDYNEHYEHFYQICRLFHEFARYFLAPQKYPITTRVSYYHKEVNPSRWVFAIQPR